MEKILKEILNWSEVWAFLLPIPFMYRKKGSEVYLKPVRWFIWVGLLLTLAINIIWRFKEDMGFREGDFLWSNNFLYNILSIARFLLFAWFFYLLKQPFLRLLKRIVPIAFVVFVLVNFIFFEDLFYYWSFSSRLLALETGLLLLYCLQYYFYILNSDQYEDRRPASFWVVTGLSVFVVINFPIFLFYKSFYKQFENFAVQIWDVTNISQVMLCILVAKAFHESGN